MAERKKILIVEDDDAIRGTMRELLELEGYEVVCAINGEEGIQALRGKGAQPGLILLDMTMPIKDGFQFREEQKTERLASDVPVLVMTADGNIESKSRRVGAHGFIRKPFDLDNLVKMVSQYCI